MVRSYKQWSHEDEVFMSPGEVHDPYTTIPPPLDSNLDSALGRLATQDVSPTGGPRGKLQAHGGSAR